MDCAGKYALVLALWGALAPARAEPTVEPWSPAQRDAVSAVEKNSPLLDELAQRIWEWAEVAFQETQSSTALAAALEQRGFRLQRQVAGMKTAFVAEYGSGKPVIAILAEFDALPGLAQAVQPHREPIPRGQAGHGCGHNLFGAASTVAALAVREAIDAQKLSGTIRLYGCPAEEGGGGKVYMVRDGLFDDVDAALHWHPSTHNDAGAQSCLAVLRFRARFHGRAAHASGSPHKGNSALDGVELMNIGTNYLREHISPQARVHYIITDGGRRPNVVPDFAESWYYVRAPQMSLARPIVERIEQIAAGAALMSQTRVELVEKSGSYELLPNQTLAKVMDANLRRAGPPAFTDADRQFAQKLRESLGVVDDIDPRRPISGPLDETIAPFGSATGLGSTDVGDVSWTTPTAGVQVATAARGAPGHSWAFVACSGHPLGRRGAHTAACVLASSAVELFENPDIVVRARAEFDEQRQASDYQSPVGDGIPPERLEAE